MKKIIIKNNSITSKIILLLIMLMVVLAGGFLFFYRNTVTMQLPDQDSTQGNQEEQPVVFSVLDEKDFEGSTTLQTYNLGQIQFKMYPWVEASNSPGYFEVWQNGKKVFSSTPNYNVGGLLAFTLGDNNYAVVKDYSGGAHCCDTDYLFRINKDNEVKLIKTFDMGNTTISKDNLVFKNNKLYFTLTDDSFQYFHAPFAASYFFQQYFELKGDQVLLANKDFESELVKKAQDCVAKISQDLQEVKKDKTLTIDSWLSDMLCKVTNYGLAGKVDMAWQGFEADFAKFKAASPRSIEDYSDGKALDAKALKQEIVNVLKDDRFK